jgi:hypothetical protein
MNTKRIVLIGLVTMSLTPAIPIASASAVTNAAPAVQTAATTRHTAAPADPWSVGSGRYRPTWLVRPRPAGQWMSIT